MSRAGFLRELLEFQQFCKGDLLNPAWVGELQEIIEFIEQKEKP